MSCLQIGHVAPPVACGYPTNEVLFLPLGRHHDRREVLFQTGHTKSGTAKPLGSDKRDNAPDAISKADKFYEFMMLTEINNLSQIST